MEIRLDGIGKRFHKDWIFRNVSLEFLPSRRYAIVGHNGSGKSTLLQIISSLSLPTEGKVVFSSNQIILPEEEIPMKLSFSSPYQELIEEMTGNELVDFHFTFRKPIRPLSSFSFFEEIGLAGNGEKKIKYFSSGMKQRMRLALCTYTEAEAYLLDEPSTNLDLQGIKLHDKLLAQIPQDKIVIISSNIESEYQMCDTILPITDFKTK
jgi:ABC-type multidrug transport system ATPase subunit